jgi:hypothetical protein
VLSEDSRAVQGAPCSYLLNPQDLRFHQRGGDPVGVPVRVLVEIRHPNEVPLDFREELADEPRVAVGVGATARREDEDFLDGGHALALENLVEPRSVRRSLGIIRMSDALTHGEIVGVVGVPHGIVATGSLEDLVHHDVPDQPLRRFQAEGQLLNSPMRALGVGTIVETGFSVFETDHHALVEPTQEVVRVSKTVHFSSPWSIMELNFRRVKTHCPTKNYITISSLCQEDIIYF